MLFIHDSIILSNDLKHYIKKKYNLNAREVIKSIITKKSYNKFYNPIETEYDYKITISTEQELKEFLNFFKQYPLLENEYIVIKRNGLSLKKTYEIIKEFDKTDLTEKIYVEQHDKNEYINFEDYGFIYDFLKQFDDSLPNNPSDLDIIVNAYDYVKKREYTRENDDSSLISKMFSTSILSPYIVCAGFVKQFNAILKEYDIPCFEYSFKDNPKEGHMVSLVYIQNKGIYFFDITKDSYNRKLNELDNISSYKGFMLPYTDYSENKLLNDNFSNELFKKIKLLNLNKRYAEQNIAAGNKEKINIFEDKKYKNADLLHTLIDTNFELLKNENFFDKVSTDLYETNLKVYDALLKIHTAFGEEIKDDDFFIEMLINAKRNTDLKVNQQYLLKSIVSRFKCRGTIDLSKSVNLINKKIK